MTSQETPPDRGALIDVLYHRVVELGNEAAQELGELHSITRQLRYLEQPLLVLRGENPPVR